MNEPPSQNTLSISNKRLVGGGIGLIITWAIVNYVPSSVAVLAATETGKAIVLWAQVILFVSSCIALVVICSLVIPTKKFRLNKFKIGPAELSFHKEELETPDED